MIHCNDRHLAAGLDIFAQPQEAIISCSRATQEHESQLEVGLAGRCSDEVIVYSFFLSLKKMTQDSSNTSY